MMHPPTTSPTDKDMDLGGRRLFIHDCTESSIHRSADRAHLDDVIDILTHGSDSVTSDNYQALSALPQIYKR